MVFNELNSVENYNVNQLSGVNLNHKNCQEDVLIIKLANGCLKISSIRHFAKTYRTLSAGGCNVRHALAGTLAKTSRQLLVFWEDSRRDWGYSSPST